MMTEDFKKSYEELMLKYESIKVAEARAAAINKFINLLIDVAVCKDNGDGTESLYVSIAKARQVSKEMVGAESG